MAGFRQMLLALAAVTLVAGACTSDDDETTTPPLAEAREDVVPGSVTCGAFPCFFTAADVLAFDPSTIDPTTVATEPLAQRAERDGPGVLLGPDLSDNSYSEATFGSPQGGTSGDTYDFHHWPYVDAVYYYFHAVFAVPPTTWVNAAHRNGVPIVGVMTGDCEGCGAELTSLFADDNRTRTVDQMVATADAFGFDGWFMDFENEFVFDDDVKAAIEELRSRTLASGRAPLVITYEAFVGGVNDQTYPIFEASGLFQGDYQRDSNPAPAPQDSYEYLDGKGQADQRFDTFWGRNIYFDSQVVQADGSPCGNTSDARWIFNGNSGGDQWGGPCLDGDRLFGFLDQIRNDSGVGPTSYQSLVLFASQWTTYSGTPPADLATARKGHHAAERLLWLGFGNGFAGDACALTDPSANGIATHVRPLSAAGFPLVTHFNTGEGTDFAIGGRTVAGRDTGWTNLSTQDVAPTFFCDVSGSGVAVGYDHADAYDGGSSLSFSGSLDSGASAEVRLFELSAQLPANPMLSVAMRSADELDVAVVLTLASGETIRVPVTASPRWESQQVALTGAAGATVVAVGVEVTSPSATDAFQASLGELRLYDGDAPDAPAPSTLSPDGAGTLSWTYDDPAQIDYANVYAVAGGCNQFVGRAFVPRYETTDHPLFDPPPGAMAYTVQPVTSSGHAQDVRPAPC